MSLLSNIKIILVATSHPGNIGAAARAMKTMGLSQLVLVNPKYFPDEHATALATGAVDVLETALVCSTLSEAIANCGLVVGTSARVRSLDWPLMNVREAASIVLERAVDQPVAVIFGREHSGLTNEELSLCHYHIQIPSNPEFSSLNLASAIQVLAYEIFCASIENMVDPRAEEKKELLATAREVELFFEHLEKTLIQLDFLDPTNPRRVLPRLRRLFSRAQLEKLEIDILRGILGAAVGKPSSRGMKKKAGEKY